MYMIWTLTKATENVMGVDNAKKMPPPSPGGIWWPSATLRRAGSHYELGRLSLNLQITINILKFWIHLENQSPDSIAELCLNISNIMAQENIQVW